MQPLGDAFVKLVRMMIAPIIFVTVIVVGIGKLTNTGEVGRIGLKALVYFEVMTTSRHADRPCRRPSSSTPATGLNVEPGDAWTPRLVASYTGAHQTTSQFLLAIIPDTIVGAFAKGDILPVLFFAVLFGLGPRPSGRTRASRRAPRAGRGGGGAVRRDRASSCTWRPLGAFGAMAFTIGRYGIGSLANLGFLMLCFYITCAVFILGVMTLVLSVTGLSMFKLLRYLREEFFIVLGTSSSEAALPTLMAKLENMGCPRPLVGLVVPLGYAFNLDGTSIYFTMAIAFIAQALNIRR